jgi:hypothetical protein
MKYVYIRAVAFMFFDFTWIQCRCDDENVTVVDEKEVLAVEA